ncbi:hypothetical protein B0H14DRAFT_2584408 [Mycena olivaceomarginata]|nr:hypothetical protein B0H14DRAFT_2584408 [Mycena olivaceomarginata]
MPQISGLNSLNCNILFWESRPDLGTPLFAVVKLLGLVLVSTLVSRNLHPLLNRRFCGQVAAPRFSVAPHIKHLFNILFDVLQLTDASGLWLSFSSIFGVYNRTLVGIPWDLNINGSINASRIHIFVLEFWRFRFLRVHTGILARSYPPTFHACFSLV